MSERSQLTRLRFGAVSAEVGLIKASTKPRGAQHETRRVLVANTAAEARDAYEQAREAVPAVTDPFGDPIPAAAATSEDVNRALAGHGPPVVGDFAGDDDAVVPAETGIDPAADPDWPAHTTEPKRQRVEHDVDPTHPDTPPAPDPVRLDEDHFERRQSAAIGSMLAQDAAEVDPSALPPESAPTSAPGAPESPGLFAPTTHERQPVREYVPPATRVEQGVHLENGTWVDLTERLEEVDRLTRVDGLEVVRTIPASSYASEHVRELHYVAGVNPDEFKVLALLWRALRTAERAAEVRWTKRTAQARGIILARGELGSRSRPAHLALLELEWPANIRKPAARVTGPIGAEVTVEEAAAALELVESFAVDAHDRVPLRDERLAKRAELLELAKAGKLAEYVPPAEPMPEDLGDDAELVEALELAAAWNREHAPA